MNPAARGIPQIHEDKTRVLGEAQPNTANLCPSVPVCGCSGGQLPQLLGEAAEAQGRVLVHGPAVGPGVCTTRMPSRASISSPSASSRSTTTGAGGDTMRLDMKLISGFSN